MSEGSAGGGEPAAAVPGSYGEPPRGRRLPAETRLGAVHLQVAELERSLAFYREVLGLRELKRADGTAALGTDGAGQPLIVLTERPGATAAGRSARLGLYHYAILLPDRAGLGRLVRHFAETGIRAGAGDHLVSEAFYLTDPDGLGIEVYADRPRESWRRRGRELVMATDPVDVDDVIEAAGDERWAGMPAGTVIGHVHLHVGDLGRAADFYSEGIGFDRTAWSYPGALFMGAGGYHHHLGTNVWAGPGARPPEPGAARLLEWTIELPDADSVTAVADSLAGAGHDVDRPVPGEMVAVDPWGTPVRVRAQRAPQSASATD